MYSEPECVYILWHLAEGESLKRCILGKLYCLLCSFVMIVAIIIEYFIPAWALQRQAAPGLASGPVAGCWLGEPLRLLACHPHRLRTWPNSPPVKRCRLVRNNNIKREYVPARTCSQMAVLLPRPSLASF